MVDSTRQLVLQQIRRVRRRLLMQVILESLAVCWAIGFLAATIWFLTRPFAFTTWGEEARWGVPAVIFALSTIGGIALGFWRCPNLVASSLALDEKFDL